MLKAITITSILVISSQSVHGQGLGMGMGAGVQTCATFNKWMVADPKHTELLYFQWAQGWMSGNNAMNSLFGRMNANLTAISTEEQQARIRYYCSEHPNELYGNAVFNLYRSLPLTDVHFTQQ